MLVKGGKCVQVLAAVDVWELRIRVSFSQKALTAGFSTEMRSLVHLTGWRLPLCIGLQERPASPVLNLFGGTRKVESMATQVKAGGAGAAASRPSSVLQQLLCC